jgi:hypothetical protein
MTRRLKRRQLLAGLGAAGLAAGVGTSILARGHDSSASRPLAPDEKKFNKQVAQKVGAFVGGASEAEAKQMEAWLGRPLDFVQDYGDEQELTSNVFRFDEWPAHRQIALSQPLSSKDGWDLAEAGAGRYDRAYQECADNLKLVRKRLISVRIGWEMNGGWMPWSSGGPGKNQKPQHYVAAFRRLARMVRAAVPGVLIDWCPNFDKPSDAYYPGDAYVDVIGSDVYLNKEYFPDSWNFVLTAPSGLNWQHRFARSHDKLISFPEWATNYDSGAFVKNMHEWMSTRPVAYQAYWNDDSAFVGSFDHYPHVKAAYLKAWGRKPGNSAAGG